MYGIEKQTDRRWTCPQRTLDRLYSQCAPALLDIRSLPCTISDNLIGKWEALHASLYTSIRRNTPSITEVQIRELGGHSPNHFYGRLLGESLQGNTHVSRLQLPVSTDCLAPKFSPPHRDHVAPLLSYIRTGPALRDVHLEGRGSMKYMEYFIDAVADSPHVVNFKIEYKLKYPAKSMKRLLTKTKSLKHLDISVIKSKGILSNALKLNQTIEVLKLGFWNDVPETEEVELVSGLPDLQSLQKLALTLSSSSSKAAIVEALSTVLPSFVSLTDVSLSHDFRAEEMDLFCEGLHANQSIVKLSLSGGFVPLAAAAFAAYMQTRNGVDTNTITSLRLYLSPFFGMSENLESCDANLLIADLLKGPCGSGLRKFELHAFRGALGIWDVMARNKTLVTLKIDIKNSARCFQCIPELPHLQELELVDYHMTKACKALCNAVKKNASLYDVSVKKSSESTISFEGWDPKAVRQVKAWGERNRHLPQLLASPHDARSNSDLRMASSDRSHGDARKISTVPLIPMLLWVAKQTPRMTLHRLFQGLLALSYSVGPRVQAPLRTAPSSL
jgi:hypothetical protein